MEPDMSTSEPEEEVVEVIEEEEEGIEWKGGLLGVERTSILRSSRDGRL